MVIYTNWFIPSGMKGLTVGPIIFIRPESKGDQGLLEHEKVHVRQFLDPRWWFKSKLEWEVAAYREQLKWYPDDRTLRFAEIISTKYGINITVEEAYKLLTQ